MNSYFDIFRTEEKNGFFIGANTPRGFISYAGGHISEDEQNRVFVIKGGPGTGKSTMMRKIGDSFPGTTYLYCSSDPDSLDGVIIEKGMKKISVTDGTAPHTYDPEYPGAVGETVDVGAGFDRKALEKRKSEIAKLTAEKREHFRKAYKYLAAAEEIMHARQRLSRPAYIEKKASRFAERFAREAGNGKNKKGTVTVRETMALSCKGAVRISGFDGAKRKIKLKDHLCLLPFFTETLTAALNEAGADIYVSPSPLGGIGEIYVKDRDVLISPFCEGEEKVINLRRFADTAAISHVRGKLSFTGKCFGMALQCALDELADAGKAHRELEGIYTPAVDFTVVDGISARLEQRIRDLLLSSD